MTIGIGVLCSTQPRPHTPRPDAIVMLSDTMGSTDTDSTDQLHKMLIDPERMIFAVCANRLERCADLWPVIQREIASLPIRNHGGYLEALNKAVLGHRAQHFRYDVMYSQYALSDQSALVPQEVIQQAWTLYDPGVEMIVGVFDGEGKALLYTISYPHRGGAWVEATTFPGNSAIGTGFYNASFWLNYRKQSLSLSVRRSIYHAFEASRMAAQAPTVNEELEIVVATKGQFVHNSTTFPTPSKDFPLSFETLKAMYAEKQAKGTDDLELFGSGLTRAIPTTPTRDP
jgi:hypothetical protein